VNEASPISASPRVQKILEAERAVMEAGGVVLRLAGQHHHFCTLGEEVPRDLPVQAGAGDDVPSPPASRAFWACDVS
jgi:hypothetical protein